MIKTCRHLMISIDSCCIWAPQSGSAHIRDLRSQWSSRDLASFAALWRNGGPTKVSVSQRAHKQMFIFNTNPDVPKAREPLLSSWMTRGSSSAIATHILKSSTASYNRIRQRPCLASRVAGSTPVDIRCSRCTNRDYYIVQPIPLQDVRICVLPVV